MLNAVPDPGGLEGVAWRAEERTDERLAGVASGFSTSLGRVIDDLYSCFLLNIQFLS